MTRTDQAFIEAYQRSAASGPASPPGPAGRYNTLHGPHAPFGGPFQGETGGLEREKAPLSADIAQRMRQAAESMAPALPDCVTQIDSFRWPQTIEKLSERHAEDYVAACSAAVTLGQSLSGRGNVLGIAGVHQGAGASTTVLAMAHSLAAVHGPIAIVEADATGERLSTSLGVLKTRSLSEAVSRGGGLAESAVYAAADRISLVVAGQFSSDNRAAARAAAAHLAEQHPLVLIDLGPVLGPVLDRQTASLSGAFNAALAIFQPAGIVLVRRASDLSGAVSAAQKALDVSGATALGMVENQISRGD